MVACEQRPPVKTCSAETHELEVVWHPRVVVVAVGGSCDLSSTGNVELGRVNIIIPNECLINHDSLWICEVNSPH